MKLRVEFETDDVVPPMLWQQCQRAMANILVGYGFTPRISVDFDSRTEAERRYWEWQTKSAEGSD
jgi:hypothetical protein